jgi:hypothetical protein
MVNQVFDKGDYLKVRRAHQQLAPAIAAIVSGRWRPAYLRNTLLISKHFGRIVLAATTF